jgi:hypothetical protein
VKDAYYFSHDANARNDPKIQALMSKWGFEGYGWYWAILETLREQPEYRYPYGRYTIKTFSRMFMCSEEKAAEFIEDCCREFVANNTSLLCIDDQWIWSESFLRRMSIYDVKRDKARVSITSRWSNNVRNTDVVRTNNERTTSKVKESKVNNTPIVPVSEPSTKADEYSSDFLLFWSTYPKRVDKGAAFKAWNARLKSGALSEIILSGTKRYARSVSGGDPRYIKNPATFLNSLAYENEYGSSEEQENHGYENWSGTGSPGNPTD